MPSRLKPVILCFLLTVLVSGSVWAQPDLNPEMLEMLAGWKQSLNLSEEQQAQVKGLLKQMGAKLEPLADQMDQEGDADMKAVFGQVKQARAEFQAEVMKVLNPDQQKAMTQIQEQIHQATLTKIAGKRAEKLKGQFDLSPEQTQQIVPIYAKQMAEMEAFVAKAKASSGDGGQPATKGGQRRQRRAKLKQAKALKSIGENADKAIKQVMNDQQWTAYKAFREEQKEQNKAKMKQKKG